MSLSLKQNRSGGGTQLTGFLKNHDFGAFVATATSLMLVGFLGLALVPTYTPEDTYAETGGSKMRVSIVPAASIALEFYNPSSSTYVSSDTLEMAMTPESFLTGAMRITASTNSPTGMKLSMNDGDSNNALVEQGDSQSSPAKPVISSITSNKTITDVTDSGKAFSDNTWGYAVADTTAGSSAAPAVPLTYSQIPTAETLLDETDELGDSAYIFTAGVRVGRTLPAGTYKDQLTFTVIANPLPLTLSSLDGEYMQDSRLATACANTATPSASETNVPTITMIDQRDNQEYTIRKLADGNCWMTENLRLGKNGAVALTSDNSDLTSGRTFNLPAATTTTGTSWGNQDEYPFVFYRDSNPGAVNPTVKPAEVTPDGPSALYNWYTATAGAKDASGNSLMTAASGQAADSVCPNNWQLPVNGGTTTDKSYGKLVYTYTGATGNSWATTTDNPKQAAINAERIVKLLDAPTSFIYSDHYSYGGTLYSRPVGLYWSSSVASATASASLAFYTDGANRALHPQNTNSKGYAFAVRCVVR